MYLLLSMVRNLVMEPSNPDVLESLPPPPPTIPPEFAPAKASHPKRFPMVRRGMGTKGQKLQLLTNHFKVGMASSSEYFFHYSVSMFYEDGTPVDSKGIGRRVLDKVHETYDSELAGKDFAYDGEKSLFTIGSLPRNILEFTVVLEDSPSNRNVGSGSPGGKGSPDESDRKRSRRQFQSKTYKVVINYAAKIPMQAIADALRGHETEHFQEAVRVLDIILRQHAAKQGCLLVRQSFFHNEPRNFTDLGGGVLGCRGFHSSFRATQRGLSLNIDVSTTMIVQPGPVVDFLLANQKVREPYDIDWVKAKRTLKSLRIQARPSNAEYKITGLSDRPCRDQTFLLKQRSGKDGEVEPIELTVYDYFLNHRKIALQYSADFPCINVGKAKRPVYIPLEVIDVDALLKLVIAEVNALKRSHYDADPLLGSSGISIGTQFSQVEGRILPAPRLKVGNGEDLFPRNGRWNFNNKRLVNPAKIERWAMVNFSARCDIRGLTRDLIKCGQMKGIVISPPFEAFEENPQFRRAPAPVRVEKMIELVKGKLPGPPQFLLCILPEKKNSDIYGLLLYSLIVVFSGTSLICITFSFLPPKKLGGINSLLTIEDSPSIPVVSRVPTIIIGMDVSHGSPGRSDIPSIAAVVSSREWPLVSRYRACVRTQSPKVEMIDSLYKRVSDAEDQGMFRDGVSESQFNQVLNVELQQIIEACKFLDEQWCPKFMVIVAQKNHHTKFFQANSPDNVPPGTVIDNKVCHPKNNDFYLCAHAGMIGTTRPTHYHVLHDELGFSTDDMQEFVHSLSYVYQRSTTAISVVAPICYAHLAAAQMSQFVKFDELSETTSSHGRITSAGGVPVPELPKLHPNVRSSMFFC
ncbi:hypothetical protein RJ639_036021 [Escallonia herrerae]|uniref:Argonaute 4 n=1 Tax=Escallonia herrerae TaxID=1293975 RepID=A0AA88WQA5_9ASTE|nr:hypothetical protein RJ639_036021 [Escallonia herrerae]